MGTFGEQCSSRDLRSGMDKKSQVARMRKVKEKPAGQCGADAGERNEDEMILEPRMKG